MSHPCISQPQGVCQAALPQPIGLEPQQRISAAAAADQPVTWTHMLAAWSSHAL